MILKEYRICMPLSVEEYHRGQIYVIGRHSEEQSEAGDGIETVLNEPCEHPLKGKGRKTVKKVHLNNKLPRWAKLICPSVYILETAYNYYPYTTTEYSCPWLTGLKILIETRYEDNDGTNNEFSDSQISKDFPQHFKNREIVHVDLVKDKVSEKHYKPEEDCTKFQSSKTGRGKLKSDWKTTSKPLMCSYKLVLVQFNLWGFQMKAETFIHGFISETLLLAHRQAVCWIDNWFDMTLDEVRAYESKIQEKTNNKVRSGSTKLASDPEKLKRQTSS